jgi:hypothetical protein
MVMVKSPYILANSNAGIEVADISAYLSVSPETIISENNYGLISDFAGYNRLLSTGNVYGNTSANYNTYVIQAPKTNLGNVSSADVTAAGTSVSTATRLAAIYNRVTAGTGGVQLMENAPDGTEISVSNETSAPIIVYMPNESGLWGIGITGTVTVAVGKTEKLMRGSAGGWVWEQP